MRLLRRFITWVSTPSLSALLLFVVVSLFVVGAHAAPVAAPNALDRVTENSAGVNKQTIRLGGIDFNQRGQPLGPPATPLLDRLLDTDGATGVKAQGNGTIKNPSGNNVPVTVTGRVSNAAAAAAIGKATLKIGAAYAQLNTAVAVGTALYDLYRELGFTPSTDTAGAFAIKKDSPNYSYACIGGNCPAWGTTPEAARAVCNSTFYPSGTQSCSIQYQTYQSISSVVTAGGGTVWQATRTQTGVTSVPSSQTELENAIASQSGWPTTSKLPAALDQAASITGEKVKPDTQVVTGPATSTGTTTTTNNTTNNTTNTQTTTHNHTYAGDTVTTSTTVTNITIDNSTGNTINNTTTTSTPAPADQPTETCGLPGKPACKIDESGTLSDPKLDASKKATDTLKPLDDWVKSPSTNLPTRPGISWSFQLPSGCTSISLAAFAPFLSSINVCQFQPMVHELMSIVWVIGTLFGGIGLFWRTALSGV